MKYQAIDVNFPLQKLTTDSTKSKVKKNKNKYEIKVKKKIALEIQDGGPSKTSGARWKKKKEQQKRNGEHKRNEYKHLQSYRRFSFLNSPATMFSCIFFISPPPYILFIFSLLCFFLLFSLFDKELTVEKQEKLTSVSTIRYFDRWILLWARECACYHSKHCWLTFQRSCI